MSNVENKLVQDFEDWREQTKKNGTTDKTIKMDLEEFMATRFQIKPSQTEGEQPLTILDILNMMISPDVDASIAANSVRHNRIACQTVQEKRVKTRSPLTLAQTQCSPCPATNVSTCQLLKRHMLTLLPLAKIWEQNWPKSVLQ